MTMSRRSSTYAMIFVAFAGSLFFGWTLGRAVGLNLTGSALWLTLGAGAGWATLIPSLVLWSRLSWAVVLRSCLVAICYGEGVLFLGGVGNLLGLSNEATLYNAGVVLVSNVVMATVLSLQLRPHGFHVWRTLLLWMVALNGGGALAFWLLRSLLEGLR